MAAQKTLSTRMKQKHGKSSEWAQAKNFTPLAGEIIVYDDLHKIKVGDGRTLVNDLPFIRINWNELDDKPLAFPPCTHTHTKSQVGLNNVDNTADINKFVKHAIAADIADTIDGYHVEWSNEYTPTNPIYICGFDEHNKKIKCANNGFIQGKLTVTGNITSNGKNVIQEGDSRLNDARPAKDVFPWAKASSKPSYSLQGIIVDGVLQLSIK